MKNNLYVNAYNQIKLLEIQKEVNNFNISDLFLLQSIINIKVSNPSKMKFTEDGYFWLSDGLLKNEYPFLKLNSDRGIAKRIAILKETGLIDIKIIGRNRYVNVTDKYDWLCNDDITIPITKTSDSEKEVKEDDTTDEYTKELESIFKKHYSNISLRFNKKKVKDKLAIKLKNDDFETIKNGFSNYIYYHSKKETEITFIKSTHLFIQDSMYLDFETIPAIKTNKKPSHEEKMSWLTD